MIEYRVSWEMPDPLVCSSMEDTYGRGVWPRLAESAWSALSWRPSENVTTSGDALDQYAQLKAWAESREQPIRSVRLEQREAPEPGAGWREVEA